MVHNVQNAKTHLSRLLAQAEAGETVVIARDGRPVAKLVAIEAPAGPRRVGFMEGAFQVPDDFDTMGAETIEGLFAGDA